VPDTTAAAVVTVHCIDHVDAAVAVAADVKKAVVARQAHRPQPPMTIDEGDSRDLVPRDSSKEAAAATGVDSLRQQEEARGTATAARAPAIDIDQAGVVPLEADEVERGVATEAVGRRNPSASDHLSVPPRKGR